MKINILLKLKALKLEILLSIEMKKDRKRNGEWRAKDFSPRVKTISLSKAEKCIPVASSTACDLPKRREFRRNHWEGKETKVSNLECRPESVT